MTLPSPSPTSTVREQQLEQRVAELEHRIVDLTTSVQAALNEVSRIVTPLAVATQAAPYMENVPFTVRDEPGVGSVYGYHDGAAHRDERDSYRSFEDIFRGSEARVRELQQPYLQVFGGRSPVADVGCGRGEFLDLLREHGVPALAADMDEGMVGHSRAKGHDVAHADANSFLEALPDDSLGGVFAAQVIEHIPYEALMRFYRLALDKLQPGGLFVAETVNPHFPASWKTFWTDLTHQHPILPEVALSYCLLTGFDSGYVFYPTGTGDPAADRIGQPAYAVVARKAG